MSAMRHTYIRRYVTHIYHTCYTAQSVLDVNYHAACLPRRWALVEMAKKGKNPKCVNYRKCKRHAKGPRSRFCTLCFVANAKLKGSESAGNVKKGKVKKAAGKRSGLRRSAKKALVVKKEWLELILASKKTWEIRGSWTSIRGWVHFAESQAGGKLRGRGRLVKCIPLSRKSFKLHYNKHLVHSLAMVPYVKLYAWVIEDAEEFKKPFEFVHKKGAVIWVAV